MSDDSRPGPSVRTRVHEVTASGIRVGTPGPATLGMDEPELTEVARIIGDVLGHPEDDAVKKRARSSVRDLMDRFPAYPG